MSQNCILISNLLLGEKTVRVAEGDAPNSFGKSSETAWACLWHAHSLVHLEPLSSLLVPSRRIELLLRDPQSRVLSVERRGQNILPYVVRARRIELLSQPWQGRVLPLNHARQNYFYLTLERKKNPVSLY